MKQILLINSYGVKPAIPPVGLEYIAETLLNGGYKVDLVDLSLEENPEETIGERIRKNRYFAICINIRNIDDTLIHTQDFFLPQSRDLVSKIKGSTEAPVIIGGPGFSIQPKEILDYVGADFGVEGCGIPALEILLRKIEKGEAERGTVFRHEPKRYLDFSFRRNTLDLKRYQERGMAIGVNTKNGCTQRCIYCPYPKIGGYKLILRDPKKVVDEIENLVNQGINKIFFADSVFNIPEEHARRICDEIIRRGLPINWHTFLNPARKYFSEEVVESMIKSGLVAAQLGIDSGSDRILEIYEKGFTTRDIEYATRLCKERGIKVSWSVLFGAPGETKETIDETFRLIDRLKPDYVDIEAAIRIYRPTKIAEIAEEKGLIKGSDDLLKPIFYPFELVDYVVQEAQKRENCHLCFADQPVYKQVEKTSR